MENFICRNCRYRFKAENPRTCPYCGKSNSFEKEKSASELLTEVDDLLKE